MIDHALLGLESHDTYLADLRRYSAAAAYAQRDGDIASHADALLDLGRTHEKLGRFSDARDAGEAALAAYELRGDDGGIAQCCHTIGVWSFHHGHEEQSFALLTRAAKTRESMDELLLAAQSWHNLGYVQSRTGRADDAFASYRRAEVLLDQLSSGSSSDLRAKAYRNRAFVWSHLTFATAEYSEPGLALDIAARYFALVAETGAHREPLLTYVGVALAYDRGRPPHGRSVSQQLAELTGLAADPELWFRAAIDLGRTAVETYHPGTGRRPYLGAMILALATYGRWSVGAGFHNDGEERLARAERLAQARGWDGEVGRVKQMAAGLYS